MLSRLYKGTWAWLGAAVAEGAVGLSGTAIAAKMIGAQCNASWEGPINSFVTNGFITPAFNFVFNATILLPDVASTFLEQDKLIAPVDATLPSATIYLSGDAADGLNGIPSAQEKDCTREVIAIGVCMTTMLVLHSLQAAYSYQNSCRQREAINNLTDRIENIEAKLSLPPIASSATNEASMMESGAISAKAAAASSHGMFGKGGKESAASSHGRKRRKASQSKRRSHH